MPLDKVDEAAGGATGGKSVTEMVQAVMVQESSGK